MLERKIKTLLITAIVATICLPLGIVGTVFGAVNEKWILLSFGIAFIVFGFYGAPFLWIGYGNLCGIKRLIECVEKDYLYKLSEIAEAMNTNEKNVELKIRIALSKRYLVGYKYENKEIILNTNEKRALMTRTIKCEGCGANVIIDPKKEINRCEYCGKIYDRKTIK